MIETAISNPNLGDAEEPSVPDRKQDASVETSTEDRTPESGWTVLVIHDSDFMDQVSLKFSMNGVGFEHYVHSGQRLDAPKLKAILAEKVKERTCEFFF